MERHCIRKCDQRSVSHLRLTLLHLLPCCLPAVCSWPSFSPSCVCLLLVSLVLQLITQSQVAIHYLLTFAHENYGRITSLDNIKHHLQFPDSHTDPPLANSSSLRATTSSPPSTGVIPTDPSSSSPSLPTDTRANATFVFLCRNKDLNGVVTSVQQMEDRFNRKFGYPWVFLNDEPFTDEFKRYAAYACSTAGCGG